MLYYIIAIPVIIIILTAVFAPKLKTRNQLVKELDSVSYMYGLKSLALDVRAISHGSGVSIMPVLRTINSANRMIGKKVRGNKYVTESEKWFYENVYLVKRFINNFDKSDFNMLPHANGEVRIITLARYIVNNSISSLNYDKIKASIECINKETALTYKEIDAFDKAISYVLVEDVYNLAIRLLHFNKMMTCGLQGKVRHDYFNSDIYLYYALKSKNSGKIYEKLSQLGLQEDSVSFNYSCSKVETTRIAEYVFGSLNRINEIINKEQIFFTLLTDAELASGNKYYKDMAYETRKLYLSRIGQISESINVSELYVAKKLVAFASYNNMDTEIILYDYKKELVKFIKSSFYLKKVRKKISLKKQYSYIFMIVILALAAGIGLYFVLNSYVLTLLSLTPLFFISELLINTILNIVAPKRPIAKMNYQEIPASASAMIVVSEFIASKDDMVKAIRHLRVLEAGNEDKNITVSLLCDLKAADSEVSPSDAEILALAHTLENEKNLLVYIRKRTKIGKRYAANERKRGAIMALVKHIITGYSGDFAYISSNYQQKPQYIIALDADNIMNIGGAKDLINIIAHPANAEYDLIATACRYNMYSIKSGYASVGSDASQLELYPNYSGLFYNLFKKDIFTGKGIFRVKEFYNKLEDVFPDGKILSHDIIEGAVLNTATGGIVYEDAPKNFASDMERKKRWARGDIQLLPFVGSCWRNQNKEKYHSDISPIYKYVIIKNFIKLCEPLFLLAILIIGAIMPKTLIYLAIIIGLPLLIDTLATIRTAIVTRQRLRYTIKNLMAIIRNKAFDLAFIPYYALNNACIIITTFYRMIKKANLLEWKTFRMSQTDSGKFARIVTPSMCVTAAIAVAIFFLTQQYIFILSYAVFSYALYFAMFAIGRTPSKKEPQNREKLLEYASRTYQYFRFMKNETPLIADNYQVKPYLGISENTSPTNIGFGLLSELSAYKLGFIDRAEFLTYIENALNIVEKMTKWQGNLYNWYNVKDCAIADSFVSSVDSGNFVASLIVLAEALKEEKEGAFVIRIEKIIKNTNLEALFDNNKRLFYLGYNVKNEKFNGHYDLLASESRLLSLIYIAHYGNANHWRNLVREFSPAFGNTLVSWSGTMFEYFMPEIFIEAPKNSLLGSSIRNALKVQMKNKVNGVFGRSESGYYAYDENLKYQYSAFGCSNIALNQDTQKRIISPYSTIIAMETCSKKCFQNLQRLENYHAIDDYGFYESVDMEGKNRVVSQYMTHHQGMCLTALCNILTGGEIRRLFTKSPKIEAVSILMTEGLYKNTTGNIIGENFTKVHKIEREYYVNIANIKYSTAGCGLTDGALSAFFDPYGGGYLIKNNIIINRFIRGQEAQSTRNFYVKKQEKFVSPTYSVGKCDMEDFSFSYTDKLATYANAKNGVKMEATLDSNLSAEILKLTIDKPENNEVCYYEPLALSSYDSQNAHPTFNNLFITTEYRQDLKAVIAKRHIKNDEKPVFVAMVVRGVNDIKFETNRYNFIGRCGTVAHPDMPYGKRHLEPSFGDVLEPCFGFTGVACGSEVEVIKLVADSYDKLIANIKAIPSNYFDFSMEAGGLLTVGEITNKLLFPMVSIPYSNNLLAELDAGGIVSEFVKNTAGNKVIAYEYDCVDSVNGLKNIARAVGELRLFGINAMLVIICASEDGNCYSFIESILRKFTLNNFKIVSEKTAYESWWKYAFIKLDSGFVIDECERYLTLPVGDNCVKNVTLSESEYKIKSGTGGFVEDGYFLPLKTSTGLPYSNVICGKNGGFIVTERGGGMFYVGNSHENRITRCDNDPVEDIAYERIFLSQNGNLCRINGGKTVCDSVKFTKGQASYHTSFDAVAVDLDEYIISDGSVKVNQVNLYGAAENGNECVFACEFMLGASFSSPFIYSKKVAYNMVFIKNILNNSICYVRVLGEYEKIKIECLNAKIIISVTPKSNAKLYFLLGATEEITQLDCQAISEKRAASLQYFATLSNIKVKSSDICLDELFNNWLPYQIVSSRLNGRCGYYQFGGATGFRDQLQDVLALLQINPNTVYEQIILHASHQYKEGDVMHWWHFPYYGLRSRITDDKLFLPYVVAEYVLSTGDKSILNVQIPFLESRPLSDNEHARYEEGVPSTTDICSLSEHCKRAFKSALKYGEHNLLLLGTGDWNDGLDYIGSRGAGESVMTSMFFVYAAEFYAKIAEDGVAKELLNIAEHLRESLNKFAYDGEQYLRLFGDDGKWYGNSKSEALQIDLISQSFAVIANIGDKTRQFSAINRAQTLVDRDAGIVKLLAPPLDENNYLGYISAYPKGVRENGGQYTHGVMWYILALLRVNLAEKAYEIFTMINPIAKCKDRNLNSAYKGEPYVLSGDVYGGAYAGRCGWSWYTGSAGWCYKILLEEFFGLQKRGDRLYVEPVLPTALDGAVVDYNGIKITFHKAAQYKLIVDGVAVHEKNYINSSQNGKEIEVYSV